MRIARHGRPCPGTAPISASPDCDFDSTEGGGEREEGVRRGVYYIVGLLASFLLERREGEGKGGQRAAQKCKPIEVVRAASDILFFRNP